MTTRDAILVLGCGEEAIATVKAVIGPRGVDLVVASSLAELLRETASRKPAAVLLGVRPDAIDGLQAIGVFHAMREKVPVIVVAGEDSLELEKKARAESIFYYLVEPVQREEIEAVIDDVLRYGKSA